MRPIRIVDEDEAAGPLKEAYDRIRRERGSVADIMKAHSLLPHTMLPHLDFYLAVQFGPKGEAGLGRAEREMIAVVVSAANGCAYCVAHHADALDRYWKDRARVDALAADWRKLGLPPRDAALCEFAERITREPRGDVPGYVEALKAAGFGDEAALQAVLTAAYFNFVNRLALASDVDPAADAAKPYRY